MEAEHDEYVNRNSKLGRLVEKVNHLEKKPLLDNCLAEILELFLRSLKESEDFLVNGIFQINFAEAALLLQSSARVYSKKVDLLWDSVNQCQKRMISYNLEENKEELERVKEREQKYKRKRKIVESHDKENKNKNSSDNETLQIDLNDMNDFLNTPYEKDSRIYSRWFKKIPIKWDLQPVSRDNLCLGDRNSHFRGSVNAIYDEDQDGELVVHVSKMESVMNLDNLLLNREEEFNEFSFQLYTDLYLKPKYLSINRLEFDCLEKHPEEFEKFVENHRTRLFLRDNNNFKSPSPELRDSTQKLRRVSVNSTVLSRLARSDLDRIYGQECQVNLLRLSIDDLSRLSRLSVDEVKVYSASVNDEKDSKLQDLRETDCSNNDHDVVFIEPQVIEVEDDANDSGTCGISDLNVDNTAASVVNCEEENNEVEPSPNTVNCVNSSDEVENVIEYVEIPRKPRKRILDDDETGNEIPEKRRRMSKAAIKKLATGVTVDLQEFNIFFSTHYNAEEGEGEVEIPDFSINDPVECSSRLDPEEDIPLSQPTQSGISCTQDSGYESVILDVTDIENVHPIPSINPSTDQVEEENNNDSQNVTSIEPCESNEETPLYQRVYEWKQQMAEKLKTITSSDFDIHKYGSSIMERFDNPESPKKFCDLVGGKSSAEVTRFFISALQLANTGNIEIQGGLSGKLSNESLSLKLLTKDHYYDRLKYYVAPSEVNYQERLETVEKLKKKRVNPSTVSGCSSRKHSRWE